MTHLKQPYYVALLCAAEIHGAAHQRPQVFQVMVAKKRAGIKCGSVRVEFCVRQNTAEIPCSRHKVPTGYMRVSSPEATAFDLVGYLNRSAGLNNTATVLAELDESLRSGPLAEVAKLSPVAWAQRLGCLLELQDRKRHRKALAAYVMRHAGKVVGLAPWKSIKGSPRDARWKVALNETVEPDTI
jgi:hypothetical protein